MAILFCFFRDYNFYRKAQNRNRELKIQKYKIERHLPLPQRILVVLVDQPHAPLNPEGP